MSTPGSNEVAGNPYAPPRAHVADVSGAAAEFEAIRLDNIKHEASVRSIGTLYYIGGGFLVIAAVLILTGVPFGGEEALPVAAIAAMYLVLGPLAIVVGRGLRQLRRWARTTSIVLAVVGLLGFPVGTLVNAYILYLLLSAKGKRLFEPDYAGIVAATPHIKYRTSIVIWILLGIIVLLVAAAVLVPMLSGVSRG
jgi:hypothetical protein